MDKKRSMGVTVIGWFEVVLSVTVLYLWLPMMALVLFESRRSMGGAIVLASGLILVIPLCSLVFVAGWLTLKLNPIGRIINIVASSIICIFLLVLLSSHFAYAGMRSGDVLINALWFLIVAITLFLVGYFIWPGAGEQFRDQRRKVFEREESFGVTLFGGFCLGNGFVMLVFGLYRFLMYSMYAKTANASSGALLLLSALFLFVCGWAILRRMEWGRKLVIYGTAAGLIIFLYKAYSLYGAYTPYMDKALSLGQLLMHPIIFSLVTFIFLTRQAVREQFQ